MIQTTYGIVKKGTYHVRWGPVEGTYDPPEERFRGTIEARFSGVEVQKMINEWKEEIAQELPGGLLDAPELPQGTPLSIHGGRTTKGTLVLALAVCDLDLDTNPEEREKWKENGWREPEDDNCYVRLYRSPTNAIRPILCKTITYTITREK